MCKRKPGKQPGAPGAHLAWNDDPDDTVPHFPAGACECGADLAGGQDLGCSTPIRSPTCPRTSGPGPCSMTGTRCGAPADASTSRTARGSPAPCPHGLSLQAWPRAAASSRPPAGRCLGVLPT
jgi:hypothetical protein